jgi:hypothetical protein
LRRKKSNDVIENEMDIARIIQNKVKCSLREKFNREE